MESHMLWTCFSLSYFEFLDLYVQSDLGTADIKTHARTWTNTYLLLVYRKQNLLFFSALLHINYKTKQKKKTIKRDRIST